MIYKNRVMREETTEEGKTPITSPLRRKSPSHTTYHWLSTWQKRTQTNIYAHIKKKTQYINTHIRKTRQYVANTSYEHTQSNVARQNEPSLVFSNEYYHSFPVAPSVQAYNSSLEFVLLSTKSLPSAWRFHGRRRSGGVCRLVSKSFRLTHPP